MKSPRISVIVPVYNMENYLENCVSSILNQTYRELEIILVNDGSTDNSGNMCNELCLKDSRIKVIHKKNGGLSDARNYGIEAATGEYLFFVDSDDYIHPEMLEIMYKAMVQYAMDIVIANHTRTSQIFKQFPILDKKEMFQKAKIFHRDDACAMLYGKEKNSQFVVACAKLYKRNVVGDIRFPVGKIHEDNFTSYLFFLNAENICYLDIELYYYYVRENSIMNRKFSEKRFDALDALDEQLIYYQNHGMKQLWELCLKYYIGYIFWYRELLEESMDKQLWNKLALRYKKVLKIAKKENIYDKEKMEYFNAPWFAPKWKDIYWRIVGVRYKLNRLLKKNIKDE